MKKKDFKKNNDTEIVYEEEGVKAKSSFSKLSGFKQKNKIKQLEQEKKEYLDGWQRAQADLVNLKKQHQEEKKFFTQIGKVALLEEIIPVLDNFDAAFANKEAWEKTPKEWRIGIEYIHKQFLDILERNDVEAFGKDGDDFNEEIYIPVESIETKNKEQKHKIAQVVQKVIKSKIKLFGRLKLKFLFNLKCQINILAN